MEDYFDDNLITPVTQSVLNVVSPIASAISVINPKLASIPIIISITNEISNYFDNKYINQRLNLLLETCQKQNIEIEKLKEIIAAMDEHSTYVLRNHIKGLLKLV